MMIYKPFYGSDRVPDPKPRWNPKPEQIQILESIFNSGNVNPSREEIQKIRIRLQEYSQIGDANVFYWFQNRKSRAKNKRRVLQKNPKLSKKKEKIISPSNDADLCFGLSNQEIGLIPGQNNELIVTEPASFLFPVHSDFAVQSGFGFGDFVVPVVTEEGMEIPAVNNDVNLEIPTINFYSGEGNSGGNCFSSISVPVSVPLTNNQSQGN